MWGKPSQSPRFYGSNLVSNKDGRRIALRQSYDYVVNIKFYTLKGFRVISVGMGLRGTI